MKCASMTQTNLPLSLWASWFFVSQKSKPSRQINSQCCILNVEYKAIGGDYYDEVNCFRLIKRKADVWLRHSAKHQ